MSSSDTKKSNRKIPKNIIFIILIILLLIGIILPSLLLYYDETIQDIVLVPSTNMVFDNSVNQEMYNGATSYSDAYKDEENAEFGYLFPQSFDVNGYMEMYDLLYENGTSVTIQMGNFYQGESLKKIYSQLEQSNKDVSNFKSIYLDDSNWSLRDYENIISIYFLANEASFVAGVLGAMYLVSTYEDPSEWNITTWGGLPYDSVVQLMSGFEQGINWFNYYYLGTDINGNPATSSGVVESLNVAPGQKVDLFNYNDEHVDYSKKALDGGKYYTNSFNAGDAEDEALVLIDQLDAKIIFPVAGGQTLDALSKIDALGSEAKVIGVDTDARFTYSEDYKDYILTSATKNVSLSTYYATWYAQERFEDESEADYEGEEINPFDFLESASPGTKGWAYDPGDFGEQVGEEMENNNTFLANFDNGGVGVTQYNEEGSELLQAWNNLVETTEDASGSNPLEDKYSSDVTGLEKFIRYSVASQEHAKDGNQLSGIENFSNTFYSLGFSASPEEWKLKHTTNYSTDAPWIPDWNTIYTL